MSVNEIVPKRILIIEDNLFNRTLLEDYLIWTGYKILAVEDGSNLLSLLEEFRPNLVLLDLKIAGVNDGLTILTQIRDHPQWLCLPVIVLTACSFDKEKGLALSAGANGFITKPMSFEELLATITLFI